MASMNTSVTNTQPLIELICKDLNDLHQKVQKVREQLCKEMANIVQLCQEVNETNKQLSHEKTLTEMYRKSEQEQSKVLDLLYQELEMKVQKDEENQEYDSDVYLIQKSSTKPETLYPNPHGETACRTPHCQEMEKMHTQLSYQKDLVDTHMKREIETQKELHSLRQEQNDFKAAYDKECQAHISDLQLIQELRAELENLCQEIVILERNACAKDEAHCRELIKVESQLNSQLSLNLRLLEEREDDELIREVCGESPRKISFWKRVHHFLRLRK